MALSNCSEQKLVLIQRLGKQRNNLLCFSLHVFSLGFPWLLGNHSYRLVSDELSSFAKLFLELLSPFVQILLLFLLLFVHLFLVLDI